MTDLKTDAKRALACLDLTDLSDDCSEQDIRALAKRARTPHGAVAAVCIWPRFVKSAKKLLSGTGVRVATVVNFPEGDHPAGEVQDMTAQAVSDGADEIDMVIPWRALMEGHPENVPARVARVKASAGSAPVKAIIESGMLADPELIRQATLGAMDGGANFIKTSTGKVPVNATPQAARVILEAIRESEKRVGFKASGGVKTTDDAATYLAIADEMFGAEHVGPETFRFGASGLLDALIATLENRDAPKSGAGY